jgi:hypothetical protein
MVKAMTSQVKRILRNRAREEAHTKVTAMGQVVEYTDNVYPTDSNILAACAMVADRVDPIIHQSANLNLNVECSPVDLSDLLNRGQSGGDGQLEQQQAIDVQAEQAPGAPSTM